MSYIKLDRALENWRYKQFPNYVALWVHILLKANHAEAKWKNVDIKRGQLLTSIEKLKQECGLTTQQVRTILKNLNGEELTIKSTNEYTLISVLKYDIYQSNEYETNKSINNQITNEQQTNNKRLTTNKKNKNNNNNNNKYNIGEFNNVKLTEDEYQKLINDYGKDNADLYIKFLDEYIEEKGYKSKSHYLSIKRWVIKAVDEKGYKETERETIPVYSDKNNPKLDTERLEEIKRKRQLNDKERKTVE